MIISTAKDISSTMKLIKETAFNLFSSKVYIDYLTTYYAYFGIIPSYKIIPNIDINKARKWIEKSFSHQIRQQHQKEFYSHERKRVECEDVMFLLDNEILIDIRDNGVVSVVYQQEHEPLAQEMIDTLKHFKHKKTFVAKIHVITNGDFGLEAKAIKCPKPKMQLSKNYNDDLQVLHKEIIKELSGKYKSGLFLFHGQPGTGKSTYIRHLINSIKKKFIFLSPRMAGNLDSPSFINFLIENRNSILVIEDAEDLLGSREKANNSAISILLNLTDGLLGESLSIKTICTFNTQVQNIDEALMRKGRLMAMYEFKPLCTEKANLLLNEMGSDWITEKPLPLSEIFNAGKKGYNLNASKNQIGFKAA